MMIDKFRLLFFGSDLFSTTVLKHILKARFSGVQVVTKPHTVLDKYAAHHQLKSYPWQKGLINVDQSSYDVGLVASFGNLIDEEAVNSFKYGLFNVHPSLLPQYRGSTPVQTSIFDDIKVTGCTIMKIPPITKFDIGEIILQERLKIRHREYAKDLMVRLADLGGEMAIEFLNNYESCIQLAKPQGEENKSLARKLKPEQGQLKFRSESRDLIDRKFRAYFGFVDIQTVCLNGLSVRLEGMQNPEQVDSYDIDQLSKISGDRVSVIENPAGHEKSLPAGLMYFHKLRRLLCIKCADNRWHAFEWVTPEAKPKMSALDFYNGYLSKVDPSVRMTDV